MDTFQKKVIEILKEIEDCISYLDIATEDGSSCGPSLTIKLYQKISELEVDYG